MKYGDVFDLDKKGAKEFVNHVIEAYGKSKNINELALSVLCETEHGQQFELCQFHNSRRFVHVCGV